MNKASATGANFACVSPRTSTGSAPARPKGPANAPSNLASIEVRCAYLTADVETLDTRLIRLQCYEGLDVTTAVYEWNYARQMLEIRLLEARGEIERATAHDIFGPEFLLKRLATIVPSLFFRFTSLSFQTNPSRWQWLGSSSRRRT